MGVRCVLFLQVFLLTGSASFAQSESALPNDGLEILTRVSKHYADAKSYHIEAVEESTYSNELQRQWSKTILSAAQDTGGHFHYEGKSGLGSALQVSDGTTTWEYRPDDHVYTKASANGSEPGQRVYTASEMSVINAKGLRGGLAHLSSHYKTATRLPDETINVNGRTVECYVVRVSPSDEKRSTDQSLEQTFWIDRQKEFFVKRKSAGRVLMFAGAGRVAQDLQTTTVYLMAELDVPLAAALFSFVPPADAKLLDAFPNPLESASGPSLKGQMIPDLKLTPAGGSALSTASLKGKVLLLEVWATWCAPCVKGLEEIASIYKDAKDKELVLATIDQDEEGKTAAEFLAKKGYQWTNAHDGDGAITKALGGSGGIPRTIVVNREGKVVYDRTGGADSELRSAIAALGPEFASLAPKPQPNPCGTQAAAVAPH